jgi:toxin HigB-1
VIRGFRHRGLRRLFEKGDRSKVPPDQLEKIENILAILDRATEPDDMDLPGFRPHPLKGGLKGFWAVRANWRVIFRFDEGHTTDVDLIDHH